ncbi:hypothetical protein GGF43_000339 [Coemansia sp. RSA 2618]|nr:hypothetical protein GGF43_000339 [Coemansia sp. RSA 2618]
MADTEIEDSQGMTQCMDELMLSVLYTELRKDIREVADALERVQSGMFRSRQPTAAASTSHIHDEESTEEMVTAESHENDDGGDNNDIPPPLSARSETFQTARGVPMVLSTETVRPPADEEPIDEDPEHVLEESARKLLDACMEIDEWRRTVCVREFIDSMRGCHATGARSPSVLSAVSARLPVAHLIDDIRERHRARAHSVGHAMPSALESSMQLSASPPLSRLLQVEQEAARRADKGKKAASHSSPRANEPHTPVSNTILPWGQVQSLHSPTLHLIDTSTTSNGAESRYKTIVDDVRIIGWVTRGSGLDVHTEFKVVVHMTRGENLTVMRRYTDFELLRDVLCERYRAFSKRIPHLPRKKAFGKFEDRFLKKRESGLQFFLAYVMLHPVIGCSSIIKQWLEGPTSW